MSGMIGEPRKTNLHKSVEWYTPNWVFDSLGISFDLDPCHPHDAETPVPASVKYTLFDDGLSKPWFGRVWLNPPYGKETPLWMNRMIDHGDGVALVFSRTDSRWCQEAMKSATAMLFVSGRVDFIPGNENQHKKARAGAGTLMFAFGDFCAAALENLTDRGTFIRIHNGALRGEL